MFQVLVDNKKLISGKVVLGIATQNVTKIKHYKSMDRGISLNVIFTFTEIAK